MTVGSTARQLFRRPVVLLGVLCLAVPLAFLGLRLAGKVTQASPTTFTVKSTGDASDASAGHGICETATLGECTGAWLTNLRSATIALLVLATLAFLVAPGGEAAGPGTRSPAASMSFSRHSPSATLLGNGNVLVGGGYDSSTNTDHTSAELSDAATNTWWPAGSMSIGRDLLPEPATDSEETLGAAEAETGVYRPLPSGEIERLICSFSWFQGCDYALTVVGCESSFNQGADRNWPYVGWWQIDVELHADLIVSLGYAAADMYSGGPNTDVAWHLSSGGTDMAAWPACRSP